MRILDKSRGKYNSEVKVRKNCFFCDSAIIKNQNCTQFDFNHWYVLVNKYPYHNGNVMLVPKNHKTKVAQLSEEEWKEFSQAIVDVQKALTKHFKTDSFNIALNEGKDSGRSVPHIHWQIIPRWKKNSTAVSIFADIQVVTLSPDDLKTILSKKSANG